MKSVGLGAIVVVEAGPGNLSPATERGQEFGALLADPLACADILGRPTVERTMEQLVRADTDVITVLLPEEGCRQPLSPPPSSNVVFQRVPDSSAAIAQTLKQYSEIGIAHAFVVSAQVYSETDLLDFFYFHREARQTVTRARDKDGALDMWVVNCARISESDGAKLLQQAPPLLTSYYIGGYVRRLGHPEEIRRLICDALGGRCAARPSGKEVRPGIWIDEGADIDRRARLVAPAYIGRNSKICEDALVTRFSSIEKNCHIDYGTVIEDSSVLSHTHIGIWLDVRHAVANGNRIWSLEHDVLLEISDSSIMRSSLARKEAKQSSVQQQRETRRVIADLQKKEKASAPDAWQLGANPIQG